VTPEHSRHDHEHGDLQPLPHIPVKATAPEPKPPRRPQRKVKRYSPDRLLRQKLVLPGDISVSAEKHNGRIVVRVETPE
jgi:hypothetical protein